jgi:hypothetical protein
LPNEVEPTEAEKAERRQLASSLRNEIVATSGLMAKLADAR